MWSFKIFLSQGLALPFILLFSAPSFGLTITNPSELPSTTFDYVIVGAGTAGLVLANRLTENSSVSVLVIEAGLTNSGVVPIEVPWLAPTLSPKSAFDWNTSTVAQVGLVNRVLPYNRGRVLGGSSSTNFLFHQYCSSEDWDRLGFVSGDAGWNWANMRQYVQKHETLNTRPTDNHNISAQVLASSHGTTGVVPISLPGFNETIDSKVYNTTQQVAEFPFLVDTSGGDTTFLGVGFVQSSASGGVRSSSSSSYLSQANTRQNLLVFANATAVKLVQSGVSAAGLPSFRKVQWIVSPPAGSLVLGSPVNVTARLDVILSAGTVGTTQLLQVSGIGNSADLAKLKINTLVSNPSVGANLTDHLLIPNIFSVNGATLDGLLNNKTQQAAAMSQWMTTRNGAYANPVANMYGFLRLPANSTIFATTPEPAAGPNAPHYEMIFTNAWFNPGTSIPATKDFLTVVTIVVSPTSRGTIKLSSSNPLQMPLVDPQFMTTAFDIFAAKESVKAAQRFIAAPPWGTYVVGPFGSVFSAAVGNDTALEAYVRGIGSSAFHPVGTVAMSAFGAGTGVTNPDLTVKGTDGLRVVDASVFPFIPSCHTQGSVYLLAERASDIIKEANNGTVAT